jgi:hypothetical protein
VEEEKKRLNSLQEPLAPADDLRLRLVELMQHNTNKMYAMDATGS